VSSCYYFSLLVVSERARHREPQECLPENLEELHSKKQVRYIPRGRQRSASCDEPTGEQKTFIFEDNAQSGSSRKPSTHEERDSITHNTLRQQNLEHQMLSSCVVCMVYYRTI
jgi:hypothetical protein